MTTATSNNTIGVSVTGGHLVTGKLSGVTVLPGTILMREPGLVQSYTVNTFPDIYVESIVLVEETKYGMSIDTPYVDGSAIKMHIGRAGDIFVLWVTSGVVSWGTNLTPDAAGGLCACIVGDYVFGICLENDPIPIYPRRTLVAIA